MEVLGTCHSDPPPPRVTQLSGTLADSQVVSLGSGGGQTDKTGAEKDEFLVNLLRKRAGMLLEYKFRPGMKAIEEILWQII